MGTLTKKQLFNKLLEQINLHDANLQTYFNNGEITKLEVHDKSQNWNFYFKLNDILPVEVFNKLNQQLKKSFYEIANTYFTVSTLNHQVNNKLLNDYWQLAIDQTNLSTAIKKNILHDVKLEVNPQSNNLITLKTANTLLSQLLPTKVLEDIRDNYYKMGFPKLNFTIELDESRRQANINDLHQQPASIDNKSYLKKVDNSFLPASNVKTSVNHESNTLFGHNISANSPVTQLKDINQEERNSVVEGYVFDKQIRSLRSGRQILILNITDYSSSITLKKFSRSEEDEKKFAKIKEGSWIKARGKVEEDNYTHDLTVLPKDINLVKHAERKDQAAGDNKRVELHLHSNMSQLQATNEVKDYIDKAKNWGHPALAITDQDDVQAFPEAYSASKKNNIKMIYGMEASVVNDGEPIAYNATKKDLSDATYVIFDIETTGLSAVNDKIIELSAVKMKGKEVLEKFEKFINPGIPLTSNTTKLTSITNDMVANAPKEEEVLKDFKKFTGDAILVGHNVTFDMGFVNVANERYDIGPISNPVIDTLTLSRFLYPYLKSYKLDRLAKKFDISLEHHHRAIYDAQTTGLLNNLLLKKANEEYDIKYHDQLNNYMTSNDAYKHARPFKVMLLAKNQTGLKNLFRLVSLSRVKYFYRTPRLPRSVLEKYRKGLLVGSSGSEGEVFNSLLQKGLPTAKKKAKFYDYLEVQPPAVYQPLIDSGLVKGMDNVHTLTKDMIKIGQEQNKPVVASGDVHYLNPEDYIYRKILVNSKVGSNYFKRGTLAPVYFRTTDEMLEDFSYLGKDLAQQVVVNNSNHIADLTDDVKPLKDKLYTPKMKGSKDKIRQQSLNKAHQLYGEQLPDLVQKRLDRELKSIIDNGFSVIYLIAQRLVAKSNKDGYLVGSRGSVGSSLVAKLDGITEVNPLPPHYRCPNCHYSKFFTKGEYNSGFDLPKAQCPKCGHKLIGDGQNIPFETFLGFTGNKVPDIDLNFSGDYQPIAHNYTKVLFGEKNVYRAGTIATVADKTAFGFVKGYEREHDEHWRRAEIDRLVKGTSGVKRTTGQHPAGIIVVPDDMDIYDFTPIQYPADDQHASWQTTHFDFHSIHDNILKIDILGHDDPTMIRRLQDLSGIDPNTIPMDDKGVMSLFLNTNALGVTPNQIFSKVGTLGIPEFGTQFVRGMLEETKPTNFSDLLQVSGLSHGTDVWLGNAEEVIKKGEADISQVIGCRDNIMTDLIRWGLNAETAFQIMESVRKGKGLKPEWKEEMRKAKVPNWYIESCLKIKYMFPRAHATAYVLMALRIAYFKLYFPLVYYAAYFSIRANDFDIIAMSGGKSAVKAAIKNIKDKGKEASAKEKNLLTVLEVANEMLERGFEFGMVDLDKSQATDWIIEGNKLIPPFDVVPGLGINVAKQIISSREDAPFLSKEDLSKRGKVSKTVIEFMDKYGVLKSLPDENQLSLFETK